MQKEANAKYTFIFALKFTSPLIVFKQYYCDHSRAHFFVEDAAVAKALKQISRTLTDKDNFKVCN